MYKKLVNIVSIILLLSLTPVLMTPVMASGLAKGKEFPPPFLEGNRIDIAYASLHRHDIPDASYITLASDQPCFVCHGFFAYPWTELSPEERKSHLDSTTRFELYINGEMVNLREWQHHYETVYFELYDETYEDVMVKDFYIQFEAGEFALGTYVFQGMWWVEGVLALGWTVHVAFT